MNFILNLDKSRLLHLLLSLPILSFGQIPVGLQLNLSFDGQLIDESSNGHSVNLVGSSVSYSTDPFGNPNSALRLDNNSYLALPLSPTIRPSTLPASVEFWFNKDPNSPQGVSPVYASSASAWEYHGFNVVINSTNRVTVGYGDGNGNGFSNRHTIESVNTITPGNWTHVIVVFRGYQDADIYIDCIQSPTTYSGGYSGNMVVANGEPSIGRATKGSTTIPFNYYTGSIDELKFWNRALSSNEIQLLCTPCTMDSTYLQDTFCSSYDFNGTIITTPGSYQDVLMGYDGCDSMVTLDLTLGVSDTTIDVQTSCDQFTWIDGNTYTQSTNQPSILIPSSTGCDSLVTLDLTIVSIDTSIVQNGITLSATTDADSWQWINCETGDSVSGAVSSTFTPTVNSTYKVIIVKDGCSDSSDCINVMGIGIPESKSTEFLVYPNPSNGHVNIELPSGYQKISIEAFDLSGRRIFRKEVSGTLKATIALKQNVPAIIKIFGDGRFIGSQIITLK